MPQTKPYIIGDPSTGGFGGTYIGVSNNDLKINQSPEMYNVLVTDTGIESRGGCVQDNAIVLKENTGTSGIFRFYDGIKQRTFVKCGNRIYDEQASGYSPFLITELIEAGDTSNQLSAWALTGGHNGNTNDGVLYWKLTNSSTTRTVSLYKNSDGAAGNLVASGSRSGDGAITLSPQNDSGLSGSVTVAYTVDDTDLANNTVTYGTISETADVFFEAWLSQYFFCDGLNMYTGSTGGASKVTFLNQNGEAITGETVTNPMMPILRNERLYIVTPTRICYTEPGYYDRVYVDPVTGGIAWTGFDLNDSLSYIGSAKYRDKLLNFKSTKCGFSIGDDSSQDLRTDFYTMLGCCSAKTIQSCGDGYIRWWSTQGIYEYSDETGLRHISKHIDNELKLIPVENRSKVNAIYWDHYYIISYPYGVNGTYCDRILMTDVLKRDEEGQPTWMPIHDWNISCMCIFEDNLLHGGRSNDGFTDKLFYGTNDNSADIECFWNSKFLKLTPGYQSAVRAIRANVLEGKNLTIHLISDRTIGIDYPVVISYPTVGVYWGDDARPELGGFMLGDDDTPGVGDILVSDDELGDNNEPFEQALPGEIRFNELQVSIYQKSADKFKLDFVEVYYAPVRALY